MSLIHARWYKEKISLAASKDFGKMNIGKRIAWLFCSKEWTFFFTQKTYFNAAGEPLSGIVMQRRGPKFTIDYRKPTEEEAAEGSFYFAVR